LDEGRPPPRPLWKELPPKLNIFLPEPEICKMCLKRISVLENYIIYISF
jgi:hypothetical protein